jgi:hypothetical protein
MLSWLLSSGFPTPEELQLIDWSMIEHSSKKTGHKVVHHEATKVLLNSGRVQCNNILKQNKIFSCSKEI